MSNLSGLAAVFVTAGLALAALYITADILPAASVPRILSESNSESSDVHRRFPDNLGRSISALLLTVGVGSLASAAGIGGGAFFTPVFNILLQFSIKGATSLSQATITGGSLAAVSLSLHKRHPIDPSRPLIDYNLSLMLLPALLLGVSVGVLANTLFPAWLITFQLAALLLYLTYLTARKAVSLHHLEQRAAVRRREAQLPPPACENQCSQEAEDCAGPVQAPQEPDPEPAAEDSIKLCRTEDVASVCQQSACSGSQSPAEAGSSGPGRPQRQQLSIQVDGIDCSHSRRQEEDPEHGTPGCSPGGGEMRSSGHRLPWLKIAEMLGLWVAFLVMQALKSRWQRCSLPFILMYSVQGVFCVVTGILFLWQAYSAQLRESEDQLHRPMLVDDIYSSTVQWSLPRLIRASFITLVGGTVAGLLGIGGGMLIGPLLLELGVHPLISTATSSLMVLFSASSAMLSLAFNSALNVEFALIFGLSCLGASLLGVLGVSHLVRKSGKASIIVMLLAGIIGAGAVLTAAFGGRTAINDLRTGHDVAFSSFCGSSSAA